MTSLILSLRTGQTSMWGNKNQNSRCLKVGWKWGVTWKAHEGNFWGADCVLYCDSTFGYVGVYID